MDLHLERHGQGEKLLFIHGAGGSSAGWYFQKEYLKRCSEVILVDLPGRGKSAGEGRRSIAEYVEITRALIVDHALGECYLVGHSMGGLIAMSLAITHPDLVKGLVLIATGARLRVSPEILEWMVENKERTVKMMMTLMAFSKKAPLALVDGAVAEMMKAPAETIFGDFFACDSADIMDEVKKIEAQTLVICGLDDRLTPPAYSDYLNRAIRGSKLVSIPDAGHMVILEKPEEVNRAIEAFVVRR
jgi:pimeloyl-ACP methyl ester carboxylesterase